MNKYRNDCDSGAIIQKDHLKLVMQYYEELLCLRKREARKSMRVSTGKAVETLS